MFIDDLHLDFTNTGRLRDLIRVVAGELIKDGDTFAVRCSGPSRLAIDWTSDRALLNAPLRNVAGNGLRPSDIVGTMARAEEPNEVRYRAAVTLTSATEFVNSANRLRGGVRRLIYISNGYDIAEPWFDDRLASLTRVARDLKVRIFSIDPRTLPGAVSPGPVLDPATWKRHVTTTQATLRVLAENTGGFAVLDVQNPAAALKRIAAVQR